MGVERTSSGTEIRKAYRAFHKRCHPDIAGPACSTMFAPSSQILLPVLPTIGFFLNHIVFLLCEKLI
ncbi:hypothetical protein AXF42_Ash000839 [Apostasia shenzhenica]|uniref:J domain-containing protein n=1 Tax=Apostasia shenzhenica TaxID=1088818 RepID=A0A2I0ATC0_9ASPA|nr:hypothetical protein AXF42_Ash000839 [Apostasia shenzhenica]